MIFRVGDWVIDPGVYGSYFRVLRLDPDAGALATEIGKCNIRVNFDPYAPARQPNNDCETRSDGNMWRLYRTDVVVRDQHMIDWLNLQVVKARLREASTP